MKKLLRSLLLIVAALMLQQRATAQDQNGTRGVTITGGQGVTKTMTDIVAASNAVANRPLGLIVKKEREMELRRRRQNPAAPAVSSYADPAFFQSQLMNAPANSQRVAAAQTIHSNYLGIYSGESGFVPPDCNGDVGPTQLVVVSNTRMKVYNKTTVTQAATTTVLTTSNTPLASPVFNIDLNTFFTDASIGVSGISDTHVRYDRLSGRWFLVAIDVTHSSNNNYCLIAVSNGSTISNASSFTFYHFRISDGGGTTSDFFDYPTLGIDKNALYMSGVIFQGVNYVGSSIFVVRKSDLLAGTLTTTFFHHGTGAGKSGSTSTAGVGIAQGVHNDDPSSTEGYLIATSNSAFSTLIIKRVTNPGSASPTLSADILVTVPTTTSPITQVASGSGAAGLDGIDDRLFAAMIMKDKITGTTSLWTAHHIEVNTSGVATAGGGRNGARWYQIGSLTGTPALIQSGTLYDAAASGARGFIMPSIAMSGQGHAVLGSSSASSTNRADAVVTGRYSSDAAGTLQPFQLATTSSTSYNPADGSPHRWGDYSQTVVDPVDNMTMWTFEEYCNSANSWGVRAIQLKAPPPATPSLSSVPGCGATIGITINGTSANNSGFFDPGADAGGPGFSRLAVTVTGPSSITVSNVVFVNPTQITCTLNTLAASAGTYKLFVTNPDGQADSVSFVLASPCSALPLKLISFSGRLDEQHNWNKLSWQTENEENFLAFDLERSHSGTAFSAITSIASRGQYANTGYAYNDQQPYPGVNYYRLKMTDRTGAYTYSDIIRIMNPVKKLAIMRVFPNPVKDDLQMEIFSDDQQAVRYMVFDYQGRKVGQGVFNLLKELSTYTIPASALTKGAYKVILLDKSAAQISQFSFVKQ